MATPRLDPRPSMSSAIEDNETEGHRQQLVFKLLVACSELVFEPTCPLNSEGRLKMMEQLRAGLEDQGAAELKKNRPLKNEGLQKGEKCRG